MTKIGVVMDPIGSIYPHKDTTLALLLEAQRRGWVLHYMEQNHLFMRDGKSFGQMYPLRVKDANSHWYELGEGNPQALSDLDVILMRKDPPFDMEYVYTTYLLDQAEHEGVLVVNKPQSLRDANEKMFTAWFPQCVPPTLVTRQAGQMRAFLQEQEDVILKPLDGMGGTSIFRLRKNDPNVGVVIETLTAHETRFAMAQRFVPEIVDGDKRILLVDGDPIPYGLARLPPPGETRANLAVGGKGHGVALSDRDRWICHQVANTLKEKGLLLVGLDIIGDYLTEINVTSPTCIRELDEIYDINISATVMDCIAERLQARKS